MSACQPGPSESTHLADAGQHIDGRSEVPNVEDGKGEFDVAIMSHAFRVILSASFTFDTFLVRSLSSAVPR